LVTDLFVIPSLEIVIPTGVERNCHSDRSVSGVEESQSRSFDSAAQDDTNCHSEPVEESRSFDFAQDDTNCQFRPKWSEIVIPTGALAEWRNLNPICHSEPVEESRSLEQRSFDSAQDDRDPSTPLRMTEILRLRFTPLPPEDGHAG
jgi:hypothetical protein